MVSFEQFIRPAILKMRGYKNLFRRAVRAEMADGYEKKAGLKYFLRARVEWRGGKYVAALTGEQGSGILKSMVLANGLVVLPEDLTAVQSEKGDSPLFRSRSFEARVREPPQSCP